MCNQTLGTTGIPLVDAIGIGIAFPALILAVWAVILRKRYNRANQTGTTEPSKPAKVSGPYKPRHRGNSSDPANVMRMEQTYSKGGDDI